MLRNDRVGHNQTNRENTRDLQNAAVRHRQNNPHVSMETAFEYILLNSSRFRALPAACIEKARRYLALPTVGIKPKQVTSEYNPPLFLVNQDGITPIGWKHIILDDSANTPEAPDNPKPTSTVVHAERVVVDDKKMIKILKFENLAYMNDLPKDYLVGLPKFYRCNGWHKEMIMLHEIIGTTNTLAYSVSPSTIMSLKDFGQMIKTMKKAAARLSTINKTAKLEREHSGEFTVSI